MYLPGVLSCIQLEDGLMHDLEFCCPLNNISVIFGKGKMSEILKRLQEKI